MFVVRLGPLERRLFLIAALALVPVAALAVFNIANSARAQRETLLEAAANTVRAVASAIDSELAMSVATLEALATSRRLRSDDLAAFHEELTEVLAQRPSWANVTLTRPDGQQLLNARRPFGSALPRAPDPDAVAEVARAGTPRVGDIVLGPVLQQHLFTVRVPIRRDGATVYLLTAGIRPDALVQVLGRQRVPAPGVVAIVDSQGNIVARSLAHEQAVGRPSSPTLRELIRQGGEGWGITSTLEGREVYTAFSRLSAAPWTAALGIPSEAVEARVQRAYLFLGSGIVASLLLGLALAYLASRTITRPVQALGEAARAMGRGERPRIPESGLPEVTQVGQALDAAFVERDELLKSEREARRLAEEASRMKDEFLAMLGHELRNPLSAISNAVEILARAGETRPELAREAAAIIRRQSDHLGRITDDLLDLARVVSGNIALQLEPMRLDEAAARTVETLRTTGRLERHRVRVDAHPAWIRADPTRIEQILVNLLTNAVKFTPAGGAIEVSAREEGAEAVLSVRDEGVGIDRELLPKIFELFVQGRRTLDRAQGGLGMGLTLVRRLAELHGGRVEAQSAGPGRGSRFTVRLPAMAEPQQGLPEQGAAAARPRRIVLVEDNEDARRSLETLLSLQGHEVKVALDGPSGVETIVRERPDLALVDLGLPGCDGFEVAREVRRRLAQGVVLVALTGYGLPQDKVRAKESGFDFHLTKPIAMADLAQAIDAVRVGEEKLAPL